jgi:putative flippase GtrA
MTAATVLLPQEPGPELAPTVEIVIPVFNEERDLEVGVRRLVAHLANGFPFAARVTIADNASTDGTWAVASRLASELPGVQALHLDRKGRGLALKHAWAASDATVVAYMDVDLSTDLAALLPLIAPLVSGHSDLAIGTRLARSARVARGAKRELISRCYNLVLHATLTTGFSDAQCGFKAVRADRARILLPLVRDDAWFFDTELLVLAERSGLRIHEVPVDWVDDPDSRVEIVPTALADLRGVLRLVRGIVRGTLPLAELRGAGRRTDRGLVQQALTFATIGAVSTAAYLLLFLLLRPSLGAQAANATSLALTAVANTAANRRFTFAVRGRRHAARHQAQGLLVFVASLALTSGALALLHGVHDPSRPVELAVLVAANLAATALRFLVLRGWVFRPRALSTPRSST